MQLRSNLERRNQIGRPGLSGCGRRRRSTAGGPVRGGAALGSLEFADSGPPGSIRPRLGSERVSAPRVNHTRHQMGSGRPTTASATGGGSVRRRTSPASGVLRGQGLQTIRLNAKRTGEGCGFSPGASGARRRRADGSSARFGGGIGAVAVDGSLRGCSETADLPGRHEWALRRWSRGQRSSEVDGGGGNVVQGSKKPGLPAAAERGGLSVLGFRRLGCG